MQDGKTPGSASPQSSSKPGTEGAAADERRTRPLTFAVSIGLLLGALTLQWFSITSEQQRLRDETVFGQATCSDKFPPPWRTHRTGNSTELMPRIQQFGLPACASMDYRPSSCNDSHFLVRCYAEDERKGFWKVYRVELENEAIFSVFPDLT